MPTHDWSRVFGGAFHDFHLSWIAGIWRALNTGVLPPDYYAMIERVAGPVESRTFASQATDRVDDEWQEEPISGGTSVAEVLPRVAIRCVIEDEPFTRRQKSIVVHHASDERIVALIEILSAGNKSSHREFQAFLTKAVDAVARGYHLLLIDLHPRTNRDPDGIYPEIWSEVGGEPNRVPPDKPLTLVALDSGPNFSAYVEPVAVGDTLIDMPLFLAPDWYVSVPLEATYQAAYRGTPRRFRAILDAGA
jgi:hypothetical protein